MKGWAAVFLNLCVSSRCKGKAVQDRVAQTPHCSHEVPGML